MEPYEIVGEYFAKQAGYMREIEAQIKKAIYLKVVSKDMLDKLRAVALDGSSKTNLNLNDYEAVFSLLRLRDRNWETLSAFFYYFTRKLGVFDLYHMYNSSAETKIVAEVGRIVCSKVGTEFVVVAGDEDLWNDVVVPECLLFLNGPYRKGLQVESIDFERRIVVGRYNK